MSEGNPKGRLLERQAGHTCMVPLLKKISPKNLVRLSNLVL